MREIKFRLWDKTESKMIAHEEIVHRSNSNLSFGFWYIFKRQDISVAMQYTGLKDKNGKEIYEGDICRLIPNEENKSNSDHMIGVRDVYFDTNYFSWYYRGCVPIDWKGFESVEIIGNIYENPELIS